MQRSSPLRALAVEINLVNGNYLTVREVWRDLEQIWKNCRQFNAQGSDIVADAVACQDVIGDLWAKAGLDKLPAPHGKATGNPAVVAGLDSAHEAIEEILDLEGASAFATPSELTGRAKWPQSLRRG